LLFLREAKGVLWRSNPPQPQTNPQAPQARNHPFQPATHLLRRRLRITEKESTHVVFAAAVVVLLKILSLCVDTRPSTLKIETGVLVARTVCAFRREPPRSLPAFVSLFSCARAKLGCDWGKCCLCVVRMIHTRTPLRGRNGGPFADCRRHVIRSK